MTEAESPDDVPPPDGWPPCWRPAGVLGRTARALHDVEKALGRQPLARLTTAGPRTARWASETLHQRITEPSPGDPRIRLTPGLIAQVAMDESLMALAVAPNRFPSRADYERVGAELALARDRLERRGFIDDPASFHPTPPPLDHPATSEGWANGHRYERLWWPSGYEAPPDLPGSNRWEGFEANRTASAWMLRHTDGPRPWLVCIHGFGMGTPFIDQAAFRAGHFHRDLGLNVVGIVLPAHGSRRPSRLSGEQFLNFDLMHAVFGMSQSLWDIRRLLGWVRAQGATAVGLAGVSLGGYLTALTAAFESELDLALAGIPVADFLDMFRHHSPRHVHMRAIEHHVLDEAAEDVMKVVSPLAMPVAAPAEARAIFAGLGDRLAPPDQARKLWRHWDEPEICWYPGNHVGFFWADKAWTFVDRLCEEKGLVA